MSDSKWKPRKVKKIVRSKGQVASGDEVGGWVDMVGKKGKIKMMVKM